jgi:putative flippase GtrA
MYVCNGIVATATHFAVLSLLMTLPVRSAGTANFIAAGAGITVSFLGSRYIVFASSKETLTSQVARFGSLYIGLAAFHGIFLHGWTDRFGYDYKVGFAIATVIQLLITFNVNKFLVFKS